MTENTLTYQVENVLVDDYIKKSNKRLFSFFFIVLLILVSSQSFIIYKRNNDVPLIPIVFATVSICTIAFFIGVRLFNDKLRKFIGAKYFINNETISQQTIDNVVKEFKFNEIAVIHKKRSGAIIVKGDSLTKIDYYRPKRSNPYQIDSVNVIFVPSITTNYSDLITRMKQLTELK